MSESVVSYQSRLNDLEYKVNEPSFSIKKYFYSIQYYVFIIFTFFLVLFFFPPSFLLTKKKKKEPQRIFWIRWIFTWLFCSILVCIMYYMYAVRSLKNTSV